MIETNCKWCKKMKRLCSIHTGYEVGRKLNHEVSHRNRRSGQA